MWPSHFSRDTEGLQKERIPGNHNNRRERGVTREPFSVMEKIIIEKVAMNFLWEVDYFGCASV